MTTDSAPYTWPDSFGGPNKTVVPIEKRHLALFRTRVFWRDFFECCDEGHGEREYPLLELEALEFPVSDRYALILDLQLGHGAPRYQLCLSGKDIAHPLVLGWHDWAISCPAVFRWPKLDAICQAIARRNPGLLHPGLPYLFLQRFADCISTHEETTAWWQLLKSSVLSLDVFADEDLEDLIGEPPSRDDHQPGQSYGWVWDDRVGWHLEGTCHSKRQIRNQAFPFGPLNAMLAEIGAG